jgi:D-3-phosphoglycerate dehydrogenase
MNILVSNIMMIRERERFSQILERRGIVPFFPDVDQFLSEPQCLDLLGEYDGWLAGDDEITKRVLEKSLPRLKVISKWGTGVDSIDLVAAKDLGISIFRSPGAFSDAVAEIALGYMLDLSRHISFTDRAVRNGQWPKPVGTGLAGKTLGIIGFGAIGRGIAERSLAMKMTVNAYDPYCKSNADPDIKMYDHLADLLRVSDFVCLCCNLTDANRHIINSRTIELCKENVTLINVARGPLVDQVSLIHALRSGRIAAAGLDVYESEPIALSSELLSMENVILGSHNANNLLSATEYVHENTLGNLWKGLGIE